MIGAEGHCLGLAALALVVGLPCSAAEEVAAPAPYVGRAPTDIGGGTPAPYGAVAGGVVSSREWVVRRAPEKEEEFIGSVRYRTGESELKADWALYRHASQAWEARGRVKLKHRLKSGELLYAEGERAAYNQKTRQGELRGPAGISFKRQPPEGEPDQGKAETLRWEGKDRARFSGGVHLWGPRLEAWSREAGYEAAEGRLLLEGGRPVLLKLAGLSDSSGWIGAVKAEKAAAFSGERRLEASGRAVGWLRFRAPETSGP